MRIISVSFKACISCRVLLHSVIVSRVFCDHKSKNVMEVALKTLYRSVFLTLARHFYRLISTFMGQTASRRKMLQCAFLDGCSDGKTTRQELLKHCIDAQTVPQLKRDFRVVSAETECSGAEDQGKAGIRVMQWNILADALSEGSDNFIKCPSETLEWCTRRISILQEILMYNPDVLCMQEVDHYHDYFKVHLARVGYSGVFKPKPDSPCLDCLNNNGPDGCAIFYKTEKLSLVDSVLPVLEAVDETQHLKLVTNQVAVLLRLRCELPEYQGKEFVVGTTHLKAKPRWHQLRYLEGLNFLEVMGQHSQGCPVILGGDFNAEPSEDVYKAFEGSKMGLDSVCKWLSADGKSEPSYTTWKIRPAGEVCHTIDYMWFSKNDLQPFKILEFPLEREIGKNRLPSPSYPSDHLSIVADFVFKS